ncbi:MAG: hypothetical protein Fur0041_12030 [Bacteroidia bacterium]
MSFIYDDYLQFYNDTNYSRTEIVPGIFSEYTGHLSDKFTMVTGIRGDLHNLAGFQLTPRLHLKYDITPKTALRISGGKGFRMANIFTESTTMFTSSRQVIIDPLKAEIAWNYGGSLQQKFNFMNREATFIIDFFRTDFENQIITDLETPGALHFYNLNGRSFANSFQADLVIEPIERFDVRLAYKYYDVMVTYDEQLKQRPLVPQHRAFINLAYALPYDKWTLDFTARWFGPSRMPEHIIAENATSIVYQSESLTKDFYLFSAHISRRFKKFDIYAGCENIANFMIERPIMGSDQPFGPVFDASLVYAPTDGRIIYAGLRMKIN